MIVAGLVALLLWLSAAPALGHEIGTTKVAVVFSERGTYDIEIVTDATALLEKLEASAGRTFKSGALVSSLEAMLREDDDVFRQRVELRLGDAPIRPLVTYSVEAARDTSQAPIAVIRLTGSVPDGASHYTWKYGWTFSTYALVATAFTSEASAATWLEGGEVSAPLPIVVRMTPNGIGTAWRYLSLGFTHILPHGLDHMLFVLGLFLLSTRTRDLLLQVSAFTVAHSITLGLSLYGLVSLQPRVVEPLIALSIAYVAIENIARSTLRPWRLALVFAFGLLHGLGFAGALREVGLPRSEFLGALLSFNVGVEAGQLAVIGLAFVIIGWQYRQCDWYRGRIVVPISAVIACTAVYWTLARAIS